MAASKKHKGLLATIEAAQPTGLRRRTWLDSVPDSHLDEVMQIKRMLRAGEIRQTKKQVAKSILQWSAENGFPIAASEITIAQWLRTDDD